MRHNPHKIRLMQHNCRKNTGIIHAILEYAKDTADIVIIQEPNTFTDPNDDTRLITISHPSFNKINPQHLPNHQNRVTTYISNTNPYLTYQTRTDINDNPDIQCIEFATPSIGTIHLINTNNQRLESAEDNSRPAEQALLEIDLPARTIIAGDMNGHHPWWNSKIKTPKNHSKIIEITEKGDLDLINTPDVMTYTYPNGKGESVIDLAFTTPDLTAEIHNWAVNKEAHAGSDHKVITFEIHSNGLETVPIPTTQKYNWGKMDWPEFRKQVENDARETEEE